MIELVERDSSLAVIAARLEDVARGTGHTVLVSGEAGVGKTSLAREVARRYPRMALWWGACDALQTPHPLAPLHDIARARDKGFAALLEAGSARNALFEAVMRDLRATGPTLFVVEDVHWADESTLDLLKFVARRIDQVPALLVLTFRDDEISSSHPLRRLIGDLPPTLVTRVGLPRLTRSGVAALARRALRSPGELFAITQGNPLFVSELLRQGDPGIPRSVQDLVLGRLAMLPTDGQAIVRLASIVPARMERWLVDSILSPPAPVLERCLDSGLLLADDAALFFRHELARVAVESSLSTPMAQSLHASALAALRRRGPECCPQARMVHHAAHARDAQSVREFAPVAARQAAERGSHREAAAHWRTALEFSASAADAERASWLEAYAVECQATDQLSQAIEAREQLARHWGALRDATREAENLSQLAMVFVLALRNADADAASRRAIELLEPLEPGVALAGAYRVEAQLRMLNRDCRESAAWAGKSFALAERLGDRQIAAAARGTLGTAMLFIDYDTGRAQLESALATALAEGFSYVAANTYSNLGSGSGEVFRLAEADRYLQEAIAYSSRHEIDFYRNYAMSWLALCDVYLGRWEDAEAHADEVLAACAGVNTTRIMALCALGRLRVRRGTPGAQEALDEALELALMTGTLQRIAPARNARAEAAFLRGDSKTCSLEARQAFDLAVRHDHSWFMGESAYWMSLAGVPAPAVDGCSEPYALQLSGRWREAAAHWQLLGCPYESARALAEGDTGARLQALREFEQLGAAPAAGALRQALRAAGIRGVPRGARATTRGNPRGLTARELEVLELLRAGLKNSEIAERLYRSVRTVDHHLGSILAKLGAGTRGEAIAVALREGILRQIG